MREQLKPPASVCSIGRAKLEWINPVEPRRLQALTVDKLGGRLRPVADWAASPQRLPNWQHAHRYSRILGKSITRTNPFWLVNVSVWSALCACATPEMR